MGRRRRTLALLALLAWIGTALSQLAASIATEERERIEWTQRRNQFLLCSSLATNALAFSTAYALLKRFRRGHSE